MTEREAAEAALLASDRRRDRGRPLHHRAGAGEIRRRVARRRRRTPGSSNSRRMTRLSGVDIGDRKLRKGAVDSVLKFAREQAGQRCRRAAGISRRQSTRSRAPAARRLALAEDGRLLGVIHLKDVVKPDVKERFAALRRMGIKTVMITGDNPVTAAAIASEAGVDDFIAEATPEDKLRYIRERAGAGPADRHVRRRHQRCAGACPGGCRRRHAERHAGRARGRQHGRSRFQPDQAHRDRRNRQAAADDARRAHDVLDRQRRREVFRHHPGDVCGVLSATCRCSTSCTCRRRKARSCRRSSSMR